MIPNLLPRRNRLDQFTPAERAIWDAIHAIEALPAHPRLTDAVVWLGQARDAVADYVETVETDANGIAQAKTKLSLAIYDYSRSPKSTVTNTVLQGAIDALVIAAHQRSDE